MTGREPSDDPSGLTDFAREMIPTSGDLRELVPYEKLDADLEAVFGTAFPPECVLRLREANPRLVQQIYMQRLAAHADFQYGRRLGRALRLFGASTDQLKRLRVDAEFTSAAFEILVGALLVVSGARVTPYPPQPPGEGKRPEYRGEYSDGACAIEAKGIEPLLLVRRFKDQIVAQHPQLGAVYDYSPDDERRVECVRDNWKLERSGASSIMTQPSSGQPGATPGRTLAALASRGVLRKAARQIDAVGLPGIVFLDKLPGPETWPAESLVHLNGLLSAPDITWTRPIGLVVVLVETLSRHQSLVPLRGPAYDSLSGTARAFFEGFESRAAFEILEYDALSD